MQTNETLRSIITGLGGAVIVALLLIAGPGRAAEADQALLLDVEINGYSIGKIGEFTDRDGALLSQPAELHDLGIQVPDGIGAKPGGLIALSDLPGVTWRLDRATQTLYLTAPNASLLPSILQIEGAVEGDGSTETGTGVTANYDISGSSISGKSSASGQFDIRGFSPWGVANTGLLAYAGASPSGPGTDSVIRLDSTYTYSEPQTLHRYRAGDFITGGLSWTRPVRMAGLQFSSDYTLRPDLITFPLPTLSGSAAVPSTLDVLVNGERLLSRQIQPGPFSIPQLPSVTGAGTISMAVTNALGQQVITSLPFYASSSLLAPGLQTFSLQAGVLRHNYGVISNDYGDAAASATYRRGLTDVLTVEGSLEGTADTFMGGAGVVLNLFDLAILNAAASASTGSGLSGEQYSIGIQRTGRLVSFGASALLADRTYRDIAAVSGTLAPRRQLNASAGLSLKQFGSISFAYAGIDRYAVPSPVREYLAPGASITANSQSTGQFVLIQSAEHAHIVSASYSVQIGNLSLYATGFRDLSNSGSKGALIGATIPLGARSSASGSWDAGSGGGYKQVQVAQTTNSPGDWGYEAFASTGGANHEFGQAEYKSSAALFTAGVDRFDRQTSYRVESQGALSLVDGGLFASDAINDSFAIVDTNGIPNIHVLDENRDVGVTDSDGLLLVPDLGAFTINHIAIVATDVALDTTLDAATKEVRPQDRSGVVVKFPVRTSHGALLRTVDEDGTPLPVGSTATPSHPKASTVPIGYDGEAYIEDLEPHNNALIQMPNGRRCSIAFDYIAIRGELPVIGPITCRMEAP